MTHTTPHIKYYDERTNKTFACAIYDEGTEDLALKELKARVEYEYRQSLSPQERAEFKKVKDDFTCPFCKGNPKISSRKFTKTSGFLFITTTVHEMFKCEDCQKEFEQYQLDNELNSAKRQNFQVENFEWYKELKNKKEIAPEHRELDSYNPYIIYNTKI